MKRVWILLVVAVLLGGCGAAETFETVADVPAEASLPEQRTVSVALPEEAGVPAMENDNDRLYVCSGYEVAVMTLPGGDLDGTLRAVSGYGADELTVMKSAVGELTRYEFVWTAATEDGQQTYRAEILDDGSYHYVLCAMTDAERANEYREVLNGIFQSFSVA